MGNFYTNITVKGPSQDMVADLVRSLGRTAIVSNTVRGWTVVYDEACEEQDIEIIAKLASELSAKLRSPVIAVLNHDDDIFIYQLYEDGNPTDEYDSCPDYFDPGAEELQPPQGGSLKKLADAFNVDYPGESAEAALRGEDYVFAVDRHQALAKALGMPDFMVGFGYRYVNEMIDSGEFFSEEADTSQFKIIGG